MRMRRGEVAEWMAKTLGRKVDIQTADDTDKKGSRSQ